MTSRLKGRRRAAHQIIGEVAAWAEQEDKVRALALVGSYARGAERMASDVDFVVLSDTPESLEDAAWFKQLDPGARLIRSGQWGPVRERRFRLVSGLIVELGIAPLSWADVPLDQGTRRVPETGIAFCTTQVSLEELPQLFPSKNLVAALSQRGIGKPAVDSPGLLARKEELV